MISTQQKRAFYKIGLMAVLILAVAAGVGWSLYNRSPKIDIDRFAGLIQKIEGNTIFLNGIYQSDKYPEVTGDRRDVQVTVTSQTKFIKQVVKFPTPEEIKASGKNYFIVGDMPKVETAGSLEDLAAVNPDGIFVTSLNNIYGQSQFTASEITYGSFDFSTSSAKK